MGDCRFCIICGQSKTDSGNNLYGIPKDPNIRKKWMNEIGKPLPLSSGWICARHFSKQHLGTKMLKKGALPSKHLCYENGTFESDHPPSTSQMLLLPEDTSQQSQLPNIIPENNENVFLPDPVPNLPSFFNLMNKIDLSSLQLPAGWGVHMYEHIIMFSKLCIDEYDNSFIECMLLIKQDTIKAQVKNKWLDMESQLIKTLDDLVEFIQKMDNTKVCTGSSQSCSIIIKSTTNFCKQCKGYKHFLKKREVKKNKNLIKKRNKSKHLIYMKHQNRHYKNVIMNLKKEKVDENKLEAFTAKIPPAQKEMVKACYKAARTTGHGNRYTLEWIYECILMKIKSPKLYFHMRDNNILALPSSSTLAKYIRNIDGSFGFRKEVFDLIKQKMQHIDEWQRHGCLLIDECKITATKKFDKNTMQFIGFVDLGDYTPVDMENTLGDHALVIMFQPFAGHGLQALACFLTRGNINGNIQAKIILECIILCENAGLLIDVVTSDGASWNRTMWKQLGVQNSLEPWCEHPVDSNRKLRMCSDFPHLVKCLRNNLENKKAFQVPEGMIRHIHFQNLYELESTKEFKMAYKLTRSHIFPKHGEKMCTRLAFQLFSNTTALALEIYREQKIELFADSEATISFCKRMDRLVNLMNSSSPLSGLKYQSEEYKELEDFLTYLDLWEQCSPPALFLSKSTAEGLKATIACTLDLVKYLTTELGFSYLMTTRINQDHLEHFFGMMRSAGGCNSHPESIQVGHIFRLMSLHSLIKPPRGSNITGGEMMKSLLEVGELKQNTNKIIFDIEMTEGIQEVVEEFSEVEEAFAYFCGYVTKKIRTVTECTECKKSIVGEGNEKFNSYISRKSRGFLTFPSQKIIQFLHELEVTISNIFENELKKNCFQVILAKLASFQPSSLLGCDLHKSEFSGNILKTYIISRLSITCAKEQKNRKMENKSRHLAKMAKLN